MNTIAFTKLHLPFGWLGNMSAHPIRWQHPSVSDNFGVWGSPEAMFQAMRFADPDVVISIWRQTSPMAAKVTARANREHMIVRPRSPEDLANMRTVLWAKVRQHALAEALAATGDALILEDCSNRRNDSGLFWGAADVDGVWVGRNELGKLWMSVRDEIRGGTGTPE